MDLTAQPVVFICPLHPGHSTFLAILHDVVHAVGTVFGWMLRGSAQIEDFVPTSTEKQYVPRISWCWYLGCHSGGQCCQDSGSC